MDKTKDKKRIWPFLWIAIFLSFIFLDLTFNIFFHDKEIIKVFVIGGHSFKIAVLENGNFLGVKCLKITAISLNLIYSIIHNKKDYFLNTALAFTLLSDTFFAFNPVSAAAVFVFCFAQFFHSLRLSQNKKITVVRAVLAALFLLVGFVSNVSHIYAFAYVYSLLIVGNIHLSYRKFEKENKEKAHAKSYINACAFAFAGFILFFLCDVFIALSFYTSTGLLPEFFNRYFSFIAWLFYYPSQILIINSAFYDSPKSRVV